ncbi:MAG: hypothetical protein KC516_00205 [Nanoarchaeota archaeon]|nr:hypothetical protein [Nanoarchaeota archaeon]
MDNKRFQVYLKEVYSRLSEKFPLGVGEKYQIEKKARELTFHYLNNPNGQEQNQLVGIEDIMLARKVSKEKAIEMSLISDAAIDTEKWFENNFIFSQNE